MRPSESLNAGVATALGILSLLLKPPQAATSVLVFTAMALLTVLLARHGRQGPLAWLRDGSAAICVPVVYLMLQPLIESLGRPLLDNTLADFDAQCCAGLVVAWRSAFGRPNGFTDLVYLAYLSYYGLPLVVAALAWRRGPAVFEPVVLALLLTFYASYLGYLVWPASGPRVPEADEAAVLGGAAISQAARSFLRAAEWTPWDAFPSGHTAVALVACGLAVHVAGPGVVATLCVWALAILFATIYIQVHYVADLLAGALLAALVLWVAARRRAHRSGS